MSDINWREVDFYKFDPNIPVDVELAFDKPQENLSGEYGKWWRWGVSINGEPFLIKSGQDSSLLELIRKTGKGRGDILELTLNKNEKKSWWTVDGKTLSSEVKRDDETVKKDVETVKKDVETVKKDVETVKKDDETVKKDVETVKKDDETVKKDVETVTQVPPESGIDKMVKSLQKIQKYLDEVQMKLVSQKQAINKLEAKIKSSDKIDEEDDLPF